MVIKSAKWQRWQVSTARIERGKKKDVDRTAGIGREPSATVSLCLRGKDEVKISLAAASANQCQKSKKCIWLRLHEKGTVDCYREAGGVHIESLHGVPTAHLLPTDTDAGTVLLTCDVGHSCRYTSLGSGFLVSVLVCAHMR